MGSIYYYYDLYNLVMAQFHHTQPPGAHVPFLLVVHLVKIKNTNTAPFAIPVLAF